MRLPLLDPSAPPRVLVVGDLMIDRYLTGTCDRISPEAPVQVVNVSRETLTLGGAGNVVANLATLGAKVDFVGLAGHDFERTPLLELLGRYGLGRPDLVVDPSRVTTIKTRVMASRQQIVRFDVEMISDISTEVEAALLARIARLVTTCSVVVLSDYAKGVLSARVAREAIALCRRAQVPVLVDPKGLDYSKYRGASLITPNRKEAVAAARIAIQGAEAISAVGTHLISNLELEACLITLGEDGMALFHEGRESRLATEAREVFDVTGAGDTVIAAVAFGLAGGLPLFDACRFANKAAGIVVGKLGAATVTLEEVRLADRRAHTGFEDKTVDAETAVARVKELRTAGRKIVFTSGCFDILDAGHVRYLAAAAELGDLLVVGVNSDASVSRLKGASLPVNTEEDRARVLSGLTAVGLVVVFADETPLHLIERLAPDVLVKRGDNKEDDIGVQEVLASGGRVEVLPSVEGRSALDNVERIGRGKS